MLPVFEIDHAIEEGLVDLARSEIRDPRPGGPTVGLDPGQALGISWGFNLVSTRPLLIATGQCALLLVLLAAPPATLRCTSKNTMGNGPQ